jgi:hypothetical protein
MGKGEHHAAAAKSKSIRQRKFRRQLAHAFFPAPEVRQKIAHGETMGNRIERNPALDGTKELSIRRMVFCRPCRGFETFSD